MPPSPRPRRSELATPASNEDMFAKAAASGADLVFLDLEDACAPAERENARGKAARVSALSSRGPLSFLLRSSPFRSLKRGSAFQPCRAAVRASA